MADTNFEVRQLLKAYRGGLISEELVTQQIDELIGTADGSNGHAMIPNVFAHRREGSKPVAKMLQQTPQSQAMVFTLPAGYTGDRENSHKGDQILYVIEGSATCRVSGQECTIKAGDLVTIPAGAPHALRTGNEKLFALTVFAPPEEQMG
jgi:quercetin dioxygenase-like cupin family protein